MVFEPPATPSKITRRPIDDKGKSKGKGQMAKRKSENPYFQEPLLEKQTNPGAIEGLRACRHPLFPFALCLLVCLWLVFAVLRALTLVI
jgi:hypothetical protein